MMFGNSSDDKEAVTYGGKARWGSRAVMGAVCIWVVGIYAWCANSGRLELWGGCADDSYYNLLVQGFRAGQLNLKAEVPPRLAQLADPYDATSHSANLLWTARYSLEDMSYYNGKLYLYFGVTPALVLFWPYVLMTGHYLLHQYAVVIFFSEGFLAGVGLLVALWRRYFADVGVGMVAAATLALGLANFIPAVLQRCDVHEVAISCGYAFTMLALLLIWPALHASRRRGWWLAGASLAYGLAVGARPSLLFGAVFLVVPITQAWREKQRVWPLLLAAAGPLLLLGVGLMLYNYARFGNPLEFGQRYQLNEQQQDTKQQFGLCYLWFNSCVAFLEPARWTGRFPFVHDIAVPPLPKGAEVEHGFGVLANIPLLWLALAAPLAWRSRCGEARSRLRWFLAAMLVLFAICALTLCLHNSMCLRYEVEFVTPLIWLTIIGILGLERLLADRPVWRQLSRCGWGLMLALSMVFSLFVTLALRAEVENALGLVQLERGRNDEAVAHFRKALSIRSDYADAQYGWGNALGLQNRFDEAIAHFVEAVRLQPAHAKANFTWGNTLVLQGKFEEAQMHFLEALRLKPNYVEARCNLGNLLALQGKLDEARSQYAEALRINPDHAESHYHLADVLARQKKMGEAVTHFYTALKIKPDYAVAANDLAWILATETNGAVRNVAEAMRWAERACELTSNRVAGYLDTLGVAYSETGRFEEAVAATERAVGCAMAAGDKEMAARLGSRLEHYHAGRAYHAIGAETRRANQ